MAMPEETPRVSLENFLVGKPLSEQLAAMMRGEDDVADAQQAAPEVNLQGERKKKLDNSDREWLRKLTCEPGWNLFLGFLEEAIDLRQEHAIVLSQTDPIGNQAQIMKEWTQVAAMKEARTYLFTRLREEIARVVAEGKN